MLLTTISLVMVALCWTLVVRAAMQRSILWLRSPTILRRLYSVEVDYVPTSTKFDDMLGEDFLALCHLNAAYFSKEQVYGIRWKRQRVDRKHTSTLVLHFLDESSKTNILSNGLKIAQDEGSLGATEFVTPLQQCFRCSSFGHDSQHCAAKGPSCGVCGGSHSTGSGACCTETVPCGDPLRCEHVSRSCALCQAGHAALDKDADCPVRLRAIEVYERGMMDK